eukprot:TRINITY_DN56562_c0_g1_i1.p1 TRINITY_DN56562_c0_g1~~TRINITY_DN56562_c0_g1_i1.p1  ORF type:complete len:288 (-),score=35.46 TRINITY_DN56562_c0_g1_i1:78-941(-)
MPPWKVTSVDLHQQHGPVDAMPTSFIKRCWFKKRGCFESSTCSDLREIYKTRQMVDELPLQDPICQRPLYISTRAPMEARNGKADQGQQTFNGEHWEKCCKQKGRGPNESDKLICINTEMMDRKTLLNEKKGWCGAYACMGERDRCLKLGVKKEFLDHPTRGQCPDSCKQGCNKTTFKAECVFLGVEPTVGTEGKAAPTADFDEPLPYDVFTISALPDWQLLLSLPPLTSRSDTIRWSWGQRLHESHSLSTKPTFDVRPRIEVCGYGGDDTHRSQLRRGRWADFLIA